MLNSSFAGDAAEIFLYNSHPAQIMSDTEQAAPRRICATGVVSRFRCHFSISCQLSVSGVSVSQFGVSSGTLKKRPLTSEVVVRHLQDSGASVAPTIAAADPGQTNLDLSMRKAELAVVTVP
ncbi:MAG: hypothetical protein WAW17_13120 [Rhodococcus sp. (in: high G+C Gram-positive bacteria)]|uniref:hypothetical protein n=1 Tax=Rhodococcus sp. TaxID=1831 RepID=UPI003BAF6D49